MISSRHNISNNVFYRGCEWVVDPVAIGHGRGQGHKWLTRSLGRFTEEHPQVDWDLSPWAGSLCPFHCPTAAVRVRPQVGQWSDVCSWVYLLFLSCIINCYTSVDLEKLVGHSMVLQFPGQMRFYVLHSQSWFLSVLTLQAAWFLFFFWLSCPSPGP